MSKNQIALLTVLMLLAGAISEAREWLQTGIGSQSIGEIVGDRKTPGLWFVTIRGEHRFKRNLLARTTDNGNTWQQIHFENSVFQVLIHPRTSEILAITGTDERFSQKAEFWVSKDHGTTFELQTTTGDYPNLERAIFGRDPNVLYNFYYSLRRSSDGGKTWIKLTLPAKYRGCRVEDWYRNDLTYERDTLYVSATAFHPRGCAGKGAHSNLVLQSTDRGNSWQILYRFPTNVNEIFGVRFHTDPAFPGRFLLYGFGGIWQLTRNAITFLSPNELSSVVSVPGYPEELVGIASPRLWRSSDSGRTWVEDVQNINYSIYTLQAIGGKEKAFLAGTAMGLYKKDRNTNWTECNRGMPRSEPVRVTSLAKSGSLLYMVTWDRFLYRKRIPDQRWKTLYTRYRLKVDESIDRVLANPGAPAHLLLLGNSNSTNGPPLVLVSKDAGEHWERSSLSFTNESPGAYFDPKDPRIVYIWTNDEAYKSFDGGLTGEPLQLPRYTRQILADPGNHQILYIVADRLFQSLDGGRTSGVMRSAPGGRGVVRITDLPQRNSYLLTTVGGTIFRTTDGGESWQRRGKPDLDPDEDCDRSYYCSPTDLRARDANHYFLISASGMFFETEDGGKKWDILNYPYPARFGSIYQMTDPRDEPFFIAAENGVFQEASDKKQ